jgi:hypothetical protein
MGAGMCCQVYGVGVRIVPGEREASVGEVVKLKKSGFEEIRAEPGRLGEARAVKNFARARFAGFPLKINPRSNFSFDNPCTGF